VVLSSCINTKHVLAGIELKTSSSSIIDSSSSMTLISSGLHFKDSFVCPKNEVNNKINTVIYTFI
jgi:formylmethanofuran dehydrogenase subunit B